MGGAKAQLNGRKLEQYVRDIVVSAGYIATRQFNAKGSHNLFGGKLTIDVFVFPCERFPSGLGIEVTHQKSSGTGAHKMPHRILSIVDAWPFPGVIVIGDREGFDVYGAVEWAESQVGRNWGNSTDSNKYIGIMELADFKAWIGCKQDVIRYNQLDLFHKRQKEGNR